jgi:hypothetical protein
MTEFKLYFSDTGNRRIRVVSTDGVISTVAGNGIAGYSGDRRCQFGWYYLFY